MKNAVRAMFAAGCFWAMLVSVAAAARDAAPEGTTKAGIYACSTRAAIVELHAAIRDMRFERKRALYAAGACWDVEAGKTAQIVTDGEWGSPIEVVVAGRRFWIMQYMLRYSRPKEDENDVCKVLFAAGVGVECGWAPRKTMVAKILQIDKFAVEQLKISPDRLLDLQTLHIPDGRTFARQHGCSHPHAVLMKRQYGGFFSAPPKQP